MFVKIIYHFSRYKPFTIKMKGKNCVINGCILLRWDILPIMEIKESETSNIQVNFLILEVLPF